MLSNFYKEAALCHIAIGRINSNILVPEDALSTPSYPTCIYGREAKKRSAVEILESLPHELIRLSPKKVPVKAEWLGKKHRQLTSYTC